MAEIFKIKKSLFICLFVCLFVYLFVFCFNRHRIPIGSFPQNFVKIGLDLVEKLRISKFDWCDGGEEGEKGRRMGEGGEESYFVMV